MLVQLKIDLQKFADPERAKNLARFFKTGKGKYGEGDKFLGITVPQQRIVAKKYTALELSDLQKLLSGKIHEHRLTALLILVTQYREAGKNDRAKIVKFYLKNTKNINNWDLVDLSAPNILGNYLLDKNRAILYKFAKSKNLWKRRVAILATLKFIKNNQFNDTLKIAVILLGDKHDLIHKAVGWMLREVDKRNRPLEIKFLDKYSGQMPRTMLRYAIEKLDSAARKHYLALK